MEEDPEAHDVVPARVGGEEGALPPAGRDDDGVAEEQRGLDPQRGIDVGVAPGRRGGGGLERGRGGDRDQDG